MRLSQLDMPFTSPNFLFLSSLSKRTVCLLKYGLEFGLEFGIAMETKVLVIFPSPLPIPACLYGIGNSFTAHTKNEQTLGQLPKPWRSRIQRKGHPRKYAFHEISSSKSRFPVPTLVGRPLFSSISCVWARRSRSCPDILRSLTAITGEET